MTKKVVTRQLTIANISVTVKQKKIKHMYLRIKPPLGAVHISAPLHASDKMIEQMVLERLSWIELAQEDIKAAPVLSQKENLVTGGTIFVLGKSYTVKIITTETKTPYIELDKEQLLLFTNNRGTTSCWEVLHCFYREILIEKIPPLICHWEKSLGVTAREWRIKRMKTRWGSCNTKAHRLWFNLWLAGKPIECIEYVVLHELTHLLEPSHNSRFWGIVAKYMPDWKNRQQRLNQ